MGKISENIKAAIFEGLLDMALGKTIEELKNKFLRCLDHFLILFSK